jgi:1-acyl-sn-glycerol-3-phosphate acyltransferase
LSACPRPAARSSLSTTSRRSTRRWSAPSPTGAIFYIAKAEILEIPVVWEALAWTGGFPVRPRRERPEGLRMARELVREGHVVGVFVEGTRQRFGYPGAVHSGAPRIALKEGVPLIPAGIETFGWSRRNRRACCVIWGEPINFTGLVCNGKG